MLYYIRYFLLSLLLLFYFASANIVFASHFLGADMTYKCLGACNYRIELTHYYDCYGLTGAIPPNPDNVSMKFSCNPSGAIINPPIIVPWTLVSSIEITPVCPNTPTFCTQASGVSLNGVISTTYFQQYDLCNLGCNEVCISWASCCRDYAITSGAGGGGLQTSPLCIDLVNNVCNNSPVFKKTAHVYLCAGQPIIVNQGATDIDGDSLSYSIGNCYAVGTTSINYNPGYSPIAPLGPTWQISINAKTGDVNIKPNPGTFQVGVLCIYVTEWRKINGIHTQIGQISRDIQLNVINCPTTNSAPIGATIANPTNPISNLSGALQIGTTLEINACVGFPFSFDFTSIDPNATGIGANQQIDSMKISGAIASISFTAQAPATQLNPKVIYGHSPLIGHFNVLCLAPGTYIFTVTLKDNYCALYGINDYTLIINAHCCVNDWASASNNGNGCLGNSITLSAVGGTNYSWAGPNGFSSILQNPLLTNLNVNMAGIYTVMVTDTNNCTDTASTNVVLSPNPIPNANSTFNILWGDSVLLNASGGGMYFWQPPTNLSSTTIANPVANPTVTTTYYVTVTNAAGCTDIDTVLVNVGAQAIAPAIWAQFIRIYPNPTDGDLFVNATDLPKDDYSIELYAINGELIKQEVISVIDGHLQVAFQLENMSSGAYQLRIISKTGNGEFRVKVQKK